MQEKVDYFNQDYGTMEAELEILSKEQVLRIEIDSGLEKAMQELGELKSQLPKEQGKRLFDQCKDNALNAITGHFGLAAVVLGSQDGGNVNTTHNVRKDIYASKKEREAYENRGEYNADTYHQDRAYIEANKKQSILKKEGKAKDYMTGQDIKPNDKTDLDHIRSAKEIHDDKARVLAEVDGTELANTESNLKLTDSSLNRAKGAKSAQEFLENRDKRITQLETNKAKRGYLTESEQKEMAKLEKQKAIDDEALIRQYEEEKKQQDKKVDKAYYTSAKPYKEALITGAKDAGKMAVYSAIGIILKEFVSGMMSELKILFQEFGKESLKDIFKRFKNRIKIIWENLRAKWKDIIAGSFEAGIVAFFSNFVVFAINVFFTTIKKLVQVIRAGFTSLYQAVKILINPPKDMPKEDALFEASKVFVAGIISALAMLSSEAIGKWLQAIPGLNVLLTIPIPLTNETIGDALCLCVSAALGALLSTIAIYYMDKWASQSKEDRLQIRIMTKSGEIVQYKIAQSYFAIYDGYNFLARSVEENLSTLTNAQKEMENSRERIAISANKRTNAMQRLTQFAFNQDTKTK